MSGVREERKNAALTAEATAEPSDALTAEATAEPSIAPTAKAAAALRGEPTAEAGAGLSGALTAEATAELSGALTAKATAEPGTAPSAEVTAEPGAVPPVEPSSASSAASMPASPDRSFLARPSDSSAHLRAAIFCFSDRGAALAERIAGLFPSARTVRPRGDLAARTAECFRECDALIFVGAAGIAVRAIAPHVAAKTADPAVIVADDCGRHVVSLLSGHIGGANRLTRQIAARIGAAEQAMRRAGVTPEQVDLLVIATDTPDYLSPATASVVQAKLGARNAGTYDLNSACAGWVTGSAGVGSRSSAAVSSGCSRGCSRRPTAPRRSW